MRPSISVTLEPGLERGIPWGRDLYTFVTSAAGHMMRTLQKPRKNRPSKRQVNHRRFLHNMIQRKFADIEAANHRLASALYIQEEEKDNSSPPSQKQSAISSQNVNLQDPDKRSDHTDAGGIAKSQRDVSVSSPETEISEKKQLQSRHLPKHHPKSQYTTGNTRKNNQSKERQNKDSRYEPSSSLSPLSSHRAERRLSEHYDNDRQLKPTNNVSEDSQTSQQDSGFIQFEQHVDVSSSFSPELSPLSLDLCDFSIQMFTDISTCSQAHRSIADISESQWTDFIDLFSVSSKDLGGCEDVEAYFESICACQGDTGQEVGADNVGFADQSVVEDLHCETGRYTYQYSCHGDQGLTINHFHDQRSSRQIEDAAETELNHFKLNQQRDVIQNQLHTSISCHYDTSELQTYQHAQVQRPCMLENREKNPDFTPFEGIAQSFSVPLENAEHHPILTLPLEDDWLFSDILKDRKSPDCY